MAKSGATASPKTKAAPRAKPSKKHRTKGSVPAYKLLLSAIKQATQLYNTDQPDRKIVATLAGFSDFKSSTVAHALTKLKKDGLVEYSSGSTIRLTDSGNEEAGPVELPTNEESLDNIKTRLKGPKAVSILEILSDGCAHSREELASHLGIANMKSSTFAHAVSSVRTQHILEDVTDELSGVKMVRLIDSVFPEGRPTASSSLD